MAMSLPPSVGIMLNEKVFAHVATLMPDGSPHNSVVWIDVDGDNVLINTAEGRVKARNVRRDPRVAISVVDDDNPYQNVVIRGRVTELRHEGADAHIDKLAKKYMGVDRYPGHNPSEQRVILVIEADHVKAPGI